MTWLQSRVFELNLCVVYIDLLLWDWLRDLWGLLLGTLVMAMTKVVYDHADRLRSLDMLLGITDTLAGVSQRLLNRLCNRSTRRLERVHRPY